VSGGGGAGKRRFVLADKTGLLPADEHNEHNEHNERMNADHVNK
jgi:hypothetical protein